MIITSRWSRDRLFVLVGEQHVTAVWVKQNWRGCWCAQRMATVPMDSELSLTSLLASLRRVVDEWNLRHTVGIHWFLPPDILAVTLEGKTPGNESAQLVLPYAPGQTMSMLMSTHPGANVWMWIHQGWVDMIQQASESIHGHMLYLHPRAAFFAHVLVRRAPSSSFADASALHVLADGRYVHLFAGETCVRSFTKPDGATSANGLAGEREQSELNAASAVLGLPLSPEQDTGQADDRLDMVRVTSLRPVSGATLHRVGILSHSLATAAERRVRNLALAMSIAVVAGLGAMYIHQQNTAQLNQETRRELRELVPQANSAQELKTALAYQNNFLGLAGKLNEAPNLFQTLGLVIDKTPTGTTLTAVEISASKITVSVHVQNTKKAGTQIEIGDSIFKMLSVQPEMDQISNTGGVHRTYAATVAGGKP
jgi:hypothetical protein